jgi:O-antigen ligase
METAAFAILAAWLLGQWSGRRAWPQALKIAKVPVILLLLWLGATGLQAVPLPGGLLGAVSPAGRGVYSMISGTATAWAPVSLDAGATMEEFLKRAAYAAIFILTLALVDRADRLRTLAAVLVAIGFAEALYGLVNTLSGMEMLWWSPKIYYRGAVTGTFVNRNHFAGHMELTLPLGLGLLMAGLPQLGYSPTWRIFVQNTLTLLLGAWGRMLLFCVVMFAALFLTASRGGVASLFAAMGLVYVVFFALRGLGVAEGKFAPAILALAVIAAAWMGLGQLPGRYGATDTLAEDRAKVWEDCIPIISDYAVAGSGAGTFKHIYPLYQNKNTSPLFYDHAHNDYIESLIENGVAAPALLLASVALSLRMIITSYARRRYGLMRGVIFASLVGTISMLIHSMADFNFQIPANAAYFYALLAMGIAAGVIPSGHGARRDKEGREIVPAGAEGAV